VTGLVLVLAVSAVVILVESPDGEGAPHHKRKASVFVSPNGSDGNNCKRRRPCASFDRAYQAAKPGQIVDVAGGSYPTQELGRDGGKNGPKSVLFRPAEGARVTVENLTVEGASFVSFQRFRISEAVRVLNLDPSDPGSRHVGLYGLHAQTFKIVGGVSNVTVRGGRYGDTVDWQPQVGKANRDDPASSRPTGIVIDGVTFRNFTRSGSDVHTECLQVIDANRMVIRRSTFDNCDGTAAIGITDGPTDDLTIENNFLGKAGDAFYTMQITKNVRNLRLRYNSATKAAVFSDDESGGPYTVVGNYMPFSSGLCVPEGHYSHNVFAGGRCGPTDRSVRSMRFVNGNALNLHLAPNSQAINHGDPRDYPGTDIDRQGRPKNGAPDAGADERRR
jgi:hypothetical protein